MKKLARQIRVWQKRLSRAEAAQLSNRQLLLVREKLKSVLSGIFGYQALLYSTSALKIIENNLLIRNSTVISPDLQGADLVCKYAELPISSDCIDLVVLTEILQKSDDPHQILREIERILIPEGNVILLLRNPLNWLSIKNRIINFLSNKKNKPKIIAKTRLNDWFRLLGLETIQEIPVCMNRKSISIKPRFRWLDRVLTFACEYFSAYYIIVAKKKVSTLTPIRPSWRRNKKLVGTRLTEPSVKTQVENCVKQIMG